MSDPAGSARPTQARVVVIGGGIIGTSVAYHLAHLGEEVVVLEQSRLTAGTTWHSAGLVVTFGSLSETSTELRKYTKDLYLRLEAETGLTAGFKPIGFIEVAADADRLEEYRRVAAFNRYCGVDVEELGPAEIAKLFPLAKTSDLRAGFYVADDGRANPVDATMALARGAKQQGATILEETRCTGLIERDGRVVGVRTNRGEIACEYVVNCAGVWARQLGDEHGVVIPLQAAEHYYLITDRIEGLPGDLPVLEDPASYGYYREEGEGIMVGLFEPECAPWRPEGIPPDFSFGEIPPDWERMTPFLERAMARVPITLETGVKQFFCGPESFTPDLSPVVGRSPELDNYFVCAGLNSIGILTGGGLGRMMAQWIVNGDPGLDITGMNIERFQSYQTTEAYRRARTVESLGLVYRCHYPMRTLLSARGVKSTALHDVWALHGAYFRDVSGWEAPDWYAGEGVAPDPGPLTWGRPAWFEQWRAEHNAVREGVALMDMSFMTKLRVRGRHAGRLLDWLSTNEVTAEDERITYTPWLNERGTLEADLTVSRLREDDYWVVASDTTYRHVLAWLKRHRAPEWWVTIEDKTTAYAQLNVQGPQSRALMQAITSADLGPAAFPFRTIRWIEIGYERVLCARITYLGELGYELYIPVEATRHVFGQIEKAGQSRGLRLAGLKALASLRLEKGYRDYGHDIDNTDNVWSAGLGFTVKPDKAGGFLGREAALLQRRGNWKHNRMVHVFCLDPEPMLHHAEVLFRDGVAVGYVRSGSYGHTLGGAVGLAMVSDRDGVSPAWLREGTWELDIAGRRYAAKVSLRPLYDPKSERVRG
ncbi:MAG: FAD-dependent oxidoreductase [Myxococcota bacterium]